MTEKVKRDARDYLMWAGFFTDPKVEPEIFSTLPGWRQREIHYTREQRKAGREPSLEELQRFIQGDATQAIVVSLPADLSLPSLRAKLPSPDITVLDQLRPMVTEESLKSFCTSFGEGKRLANEKPTHGLYAYVWGIALVRRKLIPALPLPFYWELEEGIHRETGKIMNTRVREAHPILNWLDTQAATLLAIVP